MTDLMELASRVEAGEGPDRELDADIFLTVRPEHRGRLFNAPHYTASLDVAATLVPPGDYATGELYRLEAYSTNGVLVPTHVRASAWVPGAPRAYAATPAMALTAACLRARAHQGAAHVDQ